MSIACATLEHPLLSICVPTFNRAAHLGNLLESLGRAKDGHGRAIEVCISNNCSTDGTADVIEQWRAKYDAGVVTQTTNIGASNNVVEVTRMAHGRWILVVGDDDEIDGCGLTTLLHHLGGCDSGLWVLAAVAAKYDPNNLMGGLGPRLYGPRRIKAVVLRRGLYQFGFIGMHVIPRERLPALWKLSPDAKRQWPHVALFLRHIQSRGVLALLSPVVRQGVGNALSWRADTWAQINLNKLNIVYEAMRGGEVPRVYARALMLRELYSIRNLKSMISWKVLESRTFSFREYANRYEFFGFAAWLVALHALILSLVAATPSGFYDVLLAVTGHSRTRKAYSAYQHDATLSDSDGISRKL